MRKGAAAGRFNPVLLFLAVCWVLSACAGVRYIALYDGEIERSATELAKGMDRFLLELRDASGTVRSGYPPHEAFYREYEVELRSLVRRARSHPRNDQTTDQLLLLLDSLEALRTVHEAGPLPDEQIEVTRDLFNQSWQAVLTLEMAKKRGE